MSLNWYEKFANKKGVFIAAWLPSSFYKRYKHMNDLNDNLHMTILYIEDFADQEGDRNQILKAIEKVTKDTAPVKCEIAELGIMNDSDNTMVVNVNVTDGAAFYANLVEAIEKDWREFKREYDFLPHISLKYDNNRETVKCDELKDFSWTINKISATFNRDDESQEWFKLMG